MSPEDGGRAELVAWLTDTDPDTVTEALWRLVQWGEVIGLRDAETPAQVLAAMGRDEGDWDPEGV